MTVPKEGSGLDSRSGPAVGSAHKGTASSAGMGSTHGQHPQTGDASNPLGFKTGGTSQMAGGLPKGGSLPMIAMVGGALAVGAAYYFWNYGTTSHTSVPTGKMASDKDPSRSRDVGTIPDRNPINTNISHSIPRITPHLRASVGRTLASSK